MAGASSRGIALVTPIVVAAGAVLALGCQRDTSGTTPRDGRRVIQAGPATGGLPYSPGILVGNTLYLAGTIGEDSSNHIVPGGIEAEARQALANVEVVLHAAGMTLQDVTTVTVYITSFDDFAKFNEVYRQAFPTSPPARATVQVAALIGGAKVELQMTAVKADP
ncbi:MAG TPA: RidA family protein [Beijerinckiaceae bacterium]|nr:RidA family protein [Beijerinckiaceae bacterium]